MDSYTRSTTSNSTCFTQYPLQMLDRERQVDVTYTDVQKALDQVNHYVLLQKLSDIGFSPSLCKLMSSYLINGQKYVEYLSCTSTMFTPTSGVPQRSNLGPILFLVFINDIAEILHCQKLLFADDMKILFKIGSFDEYLLLQEDLVHINSEPFTSEY
ncbi:hypothetical protein Trydic_g4010 [Trypoxylus dichotomus]